MLKDRFVEQKVFDEFLSVSDWKLLLVHLTNPNSSGLNDQCFGSTLD